MALDEAIKVLRQHNATGASVLRITRGQALEKDLLAQVLDSCEQLISEKAEYKRLLKAAVDDIRYLINYAERNGKACDRCKYGNEMYCYADDCNTDAKWQHEIEALALLGKDTNVGHKSDGWISVKDRLPGENTLVLCYAKSTTGEGNQYFIGAIAHREFWFLKVYDGRVSHPVPHWEVTHWQPLPEPPKDGDT